MRSRVLVVPLVLLTLSDAAAGAARFPDMSWDWYKAGETYLAYRPPSPQLSTRYFRKAAEAGNPSAQYKLGEHYEKGIGIGRSDREAYRWYRASAETGNRYAEFKVGEFLENGRGTRRDAQEAARWYGRAARQGNPWGYHMLGFMLADGKGVARDEELATRYLEISVRETGDHWAKWRLAKLVRRSDPARSMRLLNEAAASGNREARRELAAMR